MTMAITTTDIDLDKLNSMQKEIVMAIENGGDFHQGITLSNRKTYKLSPSNETKYGSPEIVECNNNPPRNNWQKFKTILATFLGTRTRDSIAREVLNDTFYSAIKDYKATDSLTESTKNRNAALNLAELFREFNKTRHEPDNIMFPASTRGYHQSRI